MNRKNHKRAICVLGMHRSGTSAIMRAVNLLDVYIGSEERLMGAVEENNAKGFWEHLDIFRIHESIFSSFTHSWDDVTPLQDDWWKSSIIQEQARELKDLVIEEFSDKSLWGWKDPRTCLMIPLWLNILNELETIPSFIITLRNPVDTANSLFKRDQIPETQSYLLWHLYITSALLHTKNHNRVIIDYDKFLRDWRVNIQKCALKLDIPWPIDTQRVTDEMESFLDPGLRHSHSTLSDLEAAVQDNESLKQITKTYELCIRAEQDEDYLDSKEFTDSIDRIYYEFIKQ